MRRVANQRADEQFRVWEFPRHWTIAASKSRCKSIYRFGPTESTKRWLQQKPEPGARQYDISTSNAACGSPGRHPCVRSDRFDSPVPIVCRQSTWTKTALDTAHTSNDSNDLRILVRLLKCLLCEAAFSWWPSCVVLACQVAQIPQQRQKWTLVCHGRSRR